MRTTSHRFWQRIVWSCIVAAVPGSLYAAEVVEINQNSAMAGNVTPGDEPGFPVTISEPGSYRLTGNLTIQDFDTTAIQITADSVTLDLNGFSIIGPADCTIRSATCPSHGTGIGVQAGGLQIAGPRGVRIRNGSVLGMGLEGILMTGDGSFVEKVTVRNNAGGGMSVAGAVLESAAIQNGSFGIIALIVRDSTSIKNLGDGIILDGSGGVATGNVSSFNGGYGISAPFGTAAGNTMFLNTSFGISALCPASIVGNTIVATGADTIETMGAGCVLANNATRP
jgi:hypothetical protein